MFGFIRPMAAAALIMVSGAASAATVGFTEGLRPLVPGTTALTPPDAAGTPPGFDLGVLSGVGDVIQVFGRIVGSMDFYEIASVKPMKVEFIANGFQPDTQGVDKTAVFTLKQGGTTIFSIPVTTPTAPFVIATGIAPGAFTFSIDGSIDGVDALYDVQFSAVPLPGALPMLLAAFAGVAYVGARRARA